MKRSHEIGLAVAMMAMAVGGAARADTEAGMYGNTVVCSYPDGAVTKVYLEAGGAYTVVRGGKTIAGKWTDDGTNVCYTDTDPAPPAGAKDICVAAKAWKVGDSWTVTDPAGHSCNAVLTAGHQ